MDRSGLFAMYNNNTDAFSTAASIYYGLFSMQHRGMDATGICINQNGQFKYKKEDGMVIDVFDENILNRMEGHAGIGHVLQSERSDVREFAQPIVIRYTSGQMAVALNGGLINTEELRKELELQGAVFQTSDDAEIISVLISRARNRFETIEEAIGDIMPKLRGAYALLVMTPRKIIGVRDPLGMKPLILGKKRNSLYFSSETCIYDELDVEVIREVMPGEIVTINQDGIKSIQNTQEDKKALCAYEYIYHSRPDSVIAGLEVFEAREAMGRILAREAPVDADIIVWVPNSGLAAASGYAKAAGLPLEDAFLKNKFHCNKFVQPTEDMVRRGVTMKLAVIKSRVRGKRVVVVDDSIVKGTTARLLVDILRDAGAKEVHMRIAAPEVKFECYFGGSDVDRASLVSSHKTAEEIRDMTGADSLAFLSVEGLKEACKGTEDTLCMACFTGTYPVE
jgi:amidophosphoribosyltransferase